MKRQTLILCAAILLSATVQSFAQSVSVTAETEQRTRIKEYVVKENVPRVAVKERYRVGTQVPADVELREVPADWDHLFAAIATITRNRGSTSSILKAAA
jgi:hypothetical protein